MRATAAAVLLGFALLAATAAAQPCIKCSDCTTSHCWQICRPSCGGITPDNIIVSGDRCKRVGKEYGPSAASQACRTTQLYCSGGSQQPLVAMGAIGPTTLSQCSNIALGSCQQTANSAWSSPCGWALASGYQQCSAQQFRQFYEGETESHCRSWARSVTDVDPGSHTFGSTLGGRRMLGSA